MEESNITQSNVETPQEEQVKTQKLLLDSYIAKIKAIAEARKQVLRDEYYKNKKNKAKMKKNSQKLCRQHDKKFLKRQAKRLKNNSSKNT